MGGGGYWGSPPIGTTLEDSLAGSGLWLLEMKLFVFISVVVVFGFFFGRFWLFFLVIFFSPSGADRGAIDFPPPLHPQPPSPQSQGNRINVY